MPLNAVQDQILNLWDPVQKENVGPLLKNDEEFQDSDSRAFKLSVSPSKCSAPYSCTGCTPRKLALVQGDAA